MKLNKISMMLAAAALVSCSDDLSERFTEQAIEDSRLIQLDPNFVLGGVGEEGATTRTHWEVSGTLAINKFLPIYASAGSAGNYLNAVAKLEDQAIGLCWLGQNGGEKVYTNYQFYHFGWFNTGETALTFDKCSGALENGSMYDEITLAATTIAGKEAVPTTDFTLPSKSATSGLNYNSGIYKTDNKAIFGGEYIVYYPFNEDFKEAGTIPAVAETEIVGRADLKDPALGKATFRYSKPTQIDGGAQAAGFALKNLSTLVQLRIASVTGTNACNGKIIDQIVLYSESGKLIKQANLAADRIAGDKTGTELYASSKKTNKIVVNPETAYSIDYTNDSNPASTYITLLPAKVEDLVILIHNKTDETWAKVNSPVTEFEAGKAQQVKIDLSLDNFKDVLYAVDFTSLGNAITEAASKTNPVIEVIGDITIAAGTPPYIINNPDLTIKGDAIIVPENQTLKFNCNIESDIRILGKSCCTGTQGGRLSLWEGATINNVTMVPTEAEATTDALYDQYNPAVTFAGAATVVKNSKIDVQAGNVVVNAAVKYYGDFEVAKGAKVLVTGTTPGALQFYGATVLNNGTIEVEKAGIFNVLDASGATDADAGPNMTNNGKFIHNIDASVGGATQYMNQNGEYRCKVDQQTKLDDAYTLWTACSVIEMVNPSDYSYNLAKACKHNNQWIDIEVNATSGNTWFIDDNANPDGLNIEIGNLTVKSAFNVNYDAEKTTPGEEIAKRTLTVHGNMNVQATSTLYNSKSVVVNDSLTVSGGASVVLTYNAKNGSLAVKKDIVVANNAQFTTQDDALNITCANFTLDSKGKAVFGNRKSGKTMTVSGTITNRANCTFTINQAVSPLLIADITCTKLVEGGIFTNNSKPRVVAPEEE